MAYDRTVLATLSLLIALPFVYGGCRERSAEEPKAEDLLLLAGEMDTANRYASTVMVATNRSGTEKGSVECSGVLIGPRLVLTAGHCACTRRKATTPGDEDKTLIDSAECATTATVTAVTYEPPRQGRGVRSHATEYQGKVRPHPELKILFDPQGGVVSSRSDLAVILMDKPMEGDFPPVEFAETELEPSESIVTVGYGFGESVGGIHGKRRFTKNKVTKVLTSDGGRVLVEQQKRYLYKGDSGGPCLREGAQGMRLVGISSRGIGNESTLTSTHFHQAWLREELQRAAMAGSEVPENSP